MTRTLLLAGALSCALLATTSPTAPVRAQSAPPAYRNLDANGVDLTHGDFVLNFVEGSIGSGEEELSLVRRRNGTNASQWDDIRLLETRRPDGSLVVSVVLGSRSELFDLVGSTFVAAQANGSTLSVPNHYVHTARDGTQITFAPTDAFDNTCVPAYGVICTWLPQTIDSPNEASVDLGWESWLICNPMQLDDCIVDSSRLAGVGNSHGYSIQFTYASDGGGGQSPPPSSWQRRTGATFHNSSAGFAAQASVSYAYPSTNVMDLTDMGGRTWRFTGSGAQITGVRRPGAGSDMTTVNYSSGAVTSVTRDGVTTSYARSVVGSTATMTVTNALSQVTTVVSNMTIGRPTSVTDALNRTTSYQYDGNGRLTRVTLPEGNYVEYTLDGRGNVTQARRVAKSGSGLADIVTSASYDASCANPVTCNQPNSTTDARGYVTDYTYDSTHGGVTSVTAPAPSGSGDRPQVRYTYALTSGEYRLTEVSACASGVAPGCVGTANESRTVVGYDANGNVTSTIRRDGTGALSATTAMTYDGLGNLLTVDGPLSGSADTVRTRYNAARQVVGVIGPDPDGGGALKHRATRTAYTNGLPTAIESGTVDSQSDGDWAAFATLERVEQDYDTNARPVVQRLESSGGTAHALSQTSYDGLGRVQCTAQRMNPAEFGSLPSDACTLDTQGSYGPDRIARTTYDAAGQVSLVQTGYGVSGVQADEVASTYRSNGQVETVTDAEGNRTTYVYDGHDRLSRTRMPDPSTDNTSSATDYEELGYDAAGNVTSRRLRDATSIAFSYDRLNRMTFRDRPAGAYGEYDITYSYDLLGRLLSAVDGSGASASWGHDALGRNVTETQGTFGTKTMQYDAAGRMTRLTWPDSFYADYDHNVAGDVTAVRENGATSGIGVLATYSYDDLGRRTSLTRGNGTSTAYGYDAVSRLSSLVQDLNGSGSDLTLSFTHDPASGIATNTRSNDAYAYTGHANQNVTDTVNGLNQVTANGATSVSHDARGNISAIGATAYTYTSENRLATASGGHYLPYWPTGNLAEIYGPSGPIAYFDYVGHTLVSEYDGSSQMLRRYVHGPGVDEPLVWYEGAGTSDRRWLHADERGSIIAVSDASGNLVGTRNRYDDYGAPQGTLTGRFGYTGQPFLPELGLYYYRARIYNPALGRFMQTDPIGYGDGMNLYAYVGGDPVNLSDPSGLAPRRPKECTGSRIPDSCGNGGVAGHLSTGSLATATSGGAGGLGESYYEPGRNGSSTTAPDGTIVVTANSYGRWISFGAGALSLGGSLIYASQDGFGSPLVENYFEQQKRELCRATIREHREHHDRHVQRFAEGLRASGFRVTFNVSFIVLTADGWVRAVADVVGTIPGANPFLFQVHEIKTGDAGLSRSQAVVYGSPIAYPVGQNALTAGFAIGQPVSLVNVGIERCQGLGR